MYDIIFSFYKYAGSMPLLVSHIVGYLLATLFFVFVTAPVHNAIKAYVAKRCGDFNIVNRRGYGYKPNRSFHWIGIISLLLLKIGFTSPTNYKRNRFYRPVLGTFAVSVTGPLVYAAFSIVFIAFYTIMRSSGFFGLDSFFLVRGLSSLGQFIYFIFYAFVCYTMQISLFSMLFNLIPITPLDFGDLLLQNMRPNWVDSLRNNEMLLATALFIIAFLTIGKVDGFIDKTATDIILFFYRLFTGSAQTL